MRHRGSLVATLLLCTSCLSLSEVLTLSEEEEPEFLGHYSGVYAGIDDSTKATDRTVVVQLGTKMLIFPFFVIEGQLPTPSIFATIVDLTDETASTQEFDLGAGGVDPLMVTLPVATFLEAPACAEVPAFDTIEDYFLCVSDLASCTGAAGTVPCFAPNPFDFDQSLAGSCKDGNVCEFPLHVGGKAGLSALELRFDQETLSAGDAATEVPCDSSDWRRCVRLPRLCDFDSRIAGIYDATLEIDEQASTATLPTEPPEPFSLAVAVANNVGAIILFDGERVFSGEFDVFSYAFTANDGVNPGDALLGFRPAEGVATTVEGTLTQDAANGVVTLEAIWTEKDEETEEVLAYALKAERKSGVTTGTACTSLEGCSLAAPTCPLPNLGFENTLVLGTELTENGCPATTCERVISAEQLCGELPVCPSVSLSGTSFTLLEVGEGCRDGTSACVESERCIDVECGSLATARADDWFAIDASCTADSRQLSIDRGDLFFVGFNRIRCTDENVNVSCPPIEVDCPLGMSTELGSELTLEADGSGCTFARCEQFYWPTDVCADATLPACGGGEIPMPAIREVVDVPDCIEYVCRSGCLAADCGSQTIPDCGEQPIRAIAGCDDCLFLTCVPFTCESPPITCPYEGDVFRREVDSFVGGDGCVSTSCSSVYDHSALCPDVDPQVDPAGLGCPGGEVAMPSERLGSGCIEYTCQPSCVSGCADCLPCEDPTLIDGECLAGGGEVVISDNGCGCLTQWCREQPCEVSPTACPLDPNIPPQLTPYLTLEGCPYFGCQQTYNESQICPDVDPAVDPGALGCPVDQVPMPTSRPGVWCIEYTCQPSCTDSCDGCTPCADPVIDDGTCFATGGTIRAWLECGTCATLFCE